MAVDDALALVLILCIVSSLNEAHFTGNQPLLKEKRYSKMQAKLSAIFGTPKWKDKRRIIGGRPNSATAVP